MFGKKILRGMVALSLPTALLVGVGVAQAGAGGTPVPPPLTVSAVGTVMATSQTVAPATTTTGYSQPYGSTNSALHVSDGSGGQTQCLPVEVNLGTSPEWQQPNYVKLINLATSSSEGFAITMPNHIKDCTSARTTADVAASIGAAITAAATTAGASYGTGGTGAAVYLPILAAQYAGGYATGGQTAGATAAVTWASTHPASMQAPGGATVSQAVGGVGGDAAVAGAAGAAYLLATAPFLPLTGAPGQDCASLSSSIATAKATFAPYGANVTCGSGSFVHYAIGLAPAGLGAKAQPSAAEIATAGATLTAAVNAQESAHGLTANQPAYYNVQSAVQGNISTVSDAATVSAGDLVKVTNGGALGAPMTAGALSVTGATYGTLAGYGDLVATDIAAFNIPVVAANPTAGQCIGTGGVPSTSATGGGCNGVSIGLTDGNRAWSDPTGSSTGGGPSNGPKGMVVLSGGQYSPESYTNLGSAVIVKGLNTIASPTIIRVWSLTPVILPAIASAGGAAAFAPAGQKVAFITNLVGATISPTTGYPTGEKAASVSVGSKVFANTGAMAGPIAESNCGVAAIAAAPGSKPIDPATGNAYLDSAFTDVDPATNSDGFVAEILAGKTPANVKGTLESAATLYTQTYLQDINVGGQGTTFAYPTALCAADLAGATTGSNGLAAADILSVVTHAFVWGTEPLYTSAATQQGPTGGAKLYTCSGSAPSTTCTVAQTGMKVGGIAFTFPYTSSLPLNVTGTAITYKMPTGYTTTGCTPDASPAGNLVDAGFFQDHASSSCSNPSPSTGLYTVSDRASHNYTVGTFLQAPSVTFSGVAAAMASTANACITLAKTTAGITLGAISANILFQPMGMSNLGACIGQIKN